MGGGKSEVRRYLESLGWPVYDCDSRCKSLYDTVPGLKDRIEESLGIPFRDLRLIFDNPELKARLEALVYPIMAEDISEWKVAQSASLAFIESATARVRGHVRQGPACHRPCIRKGRPQP